MIVTLYCRSDRSEAPSPESVKRSEGKVEDGRKWAGYNPAIEARWITQQDLEKVKSRKKASDRMLKGWKAHNGDSKASRL